MKVSLLEDKSFNQSMGAQGSKQSQEVVSGAFKNLLAQGMDDHPADVSVEMQLVEEDAKSTHTLGF